MNRGGTEAVVVGGMSPHVVVAYVPHGDHSTLLHLASALHRRHVDVLDATFVQHSAGGCTFRATILATAPQARLVGAILRNVVDVSDVEIRALEAASGPSG